MSIGEIFIIYYIISTPFIYVAMVLLCYRYFEGEYPTIANKRQDLGFVCAISVIGVLINVVGLFVALCLSGFAEYGFIRQRKD